MCCKPEALAVAGIPRAVNDSCCTGPGCSGYGPPLQFAIRLFSTLGFLNGGSSAETPPEGAVLSRAFADEVVVMDAVDCSTGKSSIVALVTGVLTRGCFSPCPCINTEPEITSWPNPSPETTFFSCSFRVEVEEDAFEVFSRCTTSYIGLFDLPFPASVHKTEDIYAQVVQIDLIQYSHSIQSIN